MEEDVELCLEVQVDPASKRILSNPEKCRSTLLDVTVVKPKEMEAFGTQRTNTLRADEVRKLITSMEKQRRKKQKFLDKLKYDDTIIKVRKHDDSDRYRRSRKSYSKHRDRISSASPIDDLERKDFIGITESVEPLFCEIRRSLKNVETRITNMQDINLMISQTTVDESASEVFPRRRKRSPFANRNRLKNPSVYRVETAPHNLRSVLVCKNKDRYFGRGEKVEGKCLCENCGIIGLLMECQKHPLLSELSESQSPSSECNRRKKRARFNVSKFDDTERKNYDDIAYINQLTKRVKLLEERLALQEERVVPKEYFKKIMSKVGSNFSPKLFKAKSEISEACSGKQGKKMKIDEKLVKTSMLFDKAFPCQSNENLKCFRANLNYNKMKEHKSPHDKNDKSTNTHDDYYSGHIWRWGEEILKPGIDLKNRIVTLLTDILSKFALSENCSTDTSLKAGKPDDFTSEAFKKLIKHANTRVFNAEIDTKRKFLARDDQATNDGVKSEKNRNFGGHKTALKHGEYHEKKESAPYGKNINVSYVNPKLNQWRKDSHSELKAEDNAKGKEEFLKIVAKAKQYQKDVLWRNIWNQAKANTQTRDDKITIKIPGSGKDSKGNVMLETELTIGEVEEILRGH
ncbi:hypothetical protein BDFB_004578 [Asbolus verrucosus]|uniref:Uncharacterized protein n=1 Tax=Asbolus verrucosus TaxID=1661398 RepID=A0A482V9C5_ASBVE|nr:hypothetical protein BDFB_004578 [Asbolus verrucosus]